MNKILSKTLVRSGLIVILANLTGCIAIKEHRVLEEYTPDANTIARLKPYEARRILHSCDQVSLSSAALQGKISGQSLSLFNYKKAKKALTYIDTRTFDIKIKGINVVGDKLSFVRSSDNGVYRLSLRDVDARILVGTDGWGHLFPFVALNNSWVLGGFPDNNSGIEQARQIVNAVTVIKQTDVSLDDTAFQKVAQRYHESNPRPPFPEEARKFKVQAEAAVREKDFDGAADSYTEAIKVAPWWPEGHFNLALVLGETGDHGSAMLEMKRYLMLVPDAPDARAAQDKIYEWERKAGK